MHGLPPGGFGRTQSDWETLVRVFQESLHKAVKHSGVKRIRAELLQHSNERHLTISDSGGTIGVKAFFLEYEVRAHSRGQADEVALALLAGKGGGGSKF